MWGIQIKCYRLKNDCILVIQDGKIQVGSIFNAVYDDVCDTINVEQYKFLINSVSWQKMYKEWKQYCLKGLAMIFLVMKTH